MQGFMLNQFMIANIVIIHKFFKENVQIFFVIFWLIIYLLLLMIAGISYYYIKHLLKKQIKNILPYLLLMYKI